MGDGILDTFPAMYLLNYYFTFYTRIVPGL